MILAGLIQQPRAAALGLTQVTIACTDGTSVTVVADADMLAGLIAAVQGMVDYPAGLGCTLTQVPLLTRFGEIAVAANPNTMIVAGGRWLIPCSVLASGFQTGVPGGTLAMAGPRPASAKLLPRPLSAGTGCTDPTGCIFVNIGANVHFNGNGVLEGSINETIPENQSCPQIDVGNGPVPLGPSHFDSKPMPTSCLYVKDKTALTTTYVTHAFGFVFTTLFPLSADASNPTPVYSKFVDVGNPSTFTDTSRDSLNAPPAPPNSNCDTRFIDTQVPDFPLQNGNINVSGAS
jgi:hypothetical protein